MMKQWQTLATLPFMWPWLFATMAAIVSAACSAGDVSPTAKPRTSIATFTAEGTIEQKYIADYRNHVAARHIAVYETVGSYEDNDEEHTVAWYKDGTERLRYDIDGDWSGADIQLADLSLYIFDKPPVVLCSSDERLGPDGGCDGSGDGAGNFLYSLAFPLSLPDLEAISDDTTDLDIEGVDIETIAGYESRCYRLLRADAESRICFTPDGVQSAFSYSDSSGVVLRRELKETRQLAANDFDLPYPTIAAE